MTLVACFLTLAGYYLLVAAAHSSPCWRNTVCSGIRDTAFPGIWESNIFAPDSRNVRPRSILSAETGKLISSYPGDANLASNGSQVVFDFGREVGGVVTITYSVVAGTGGGSLGLAFTEAKDWIGEWSDSSNGGFTGDQALYSNFSGPGDVVYTMPDERLRGGFRYLTVFLVSPSAALRIKDVSLEISFQPTWANLRAYQGYFHSSDALLNNIWYAGAYTLQTNLVAPNTGRSWPVKGPGWLNNGTLGPGDTIIVDGAKRDRTVWPGDMGVAVPATFVSLGDMESVKNALQVMYDTQNADGSFFESGPPLNNRGSDTYHMWTMIGTYNYLLYTNDTAFLQRIWPAYRNAMAFLTAKQSPTTSLLEVTGTRDWGRWQTGGNLTSAQGLLHRTLTTGAALAVWAGLPPSNPLSAQWTAAAAAVRSAALRHNFDTSVGLFRDAAAPPTPETAYHPQDGNALALGLGLVDPASATAHGISAQLTSAWTPLGALAPELPGTVSPFISSLEVLGHAVVGHAGRALELMRREWGWYLSHPNGTGSTIAEGWLVNGSWAYRWDGGYAGDPSYTSHAHGWGAGPTGVLSEWILGLRVVEPAGGTWVFAPQFGGLASARGGFVTPLGRFEAGWEVRGGGVLIGAEGVAGRGGEYEAWVRTPAGSKGTVVLPVLEDGVMPRVVLDGKKEVRTAWYRRSGVVVGTVAVEVAGGEHRFKVS